MSPRYVGIDATNPVDTLAWGQAWREKISSSSGPWQNLLEPIVSERPVPGRPRMRRGAGKPLAMALVSDSKYIGRYRDACVLPLGADPEREPGTLLNDTQINDGCAFTRRFILSPSVDADGLNAVARGTVADVVLLSCHFSNNSFYGNDKKGRQHEIFNVMTEAESGLKFVGPRWLILSSCSACHETYTPWWSILLTGDSSLRGVLREKPPHEG